MQSKVYSAVLLAVIPCYPRFLFRNVLRYKDPTVQFFDVLLFEGHARDSDFEAFG